MAARERPARAKRVKKKKPQKGAPVPTVDIDGIPVFPALLKMTHPGGTVDAEKAYTATYSMINMPRGPRSNGTFTFSKKPSDEGAVIEMAMKDNQCRGFVQKLNAVMHCKKDKLSTPVKWNITEEMFEGDKPVPNTKISKSAKAKDGKPRAISWAIFDAVGRLPRKKFEPIEFTMMDHFDQLKPNQKIFYRKSLKVKLGSEQVMIHLYDHFGFGILPWTYFVNDGGIMVLAIGGMEAYSLTGIKEGAE